MKKGIIFVFIVICLLFLISFQGAFAQGLVPCGGAGQRPCSICDFGILVINITNFLIYNIAIPLAGLMIVIGGVMIMIGAASEERVKAGKKMFTNAIVGIVIVFLAWLMVDTVIKVLTGSFGQRSFFGTFGPWNSLPSGACPFGGGISPTAPVPRSTDGTFPEDPF